MSLTPLEIAAADTLISLALSEDFGELGDLTANATIPEHARGSASIVARQDGVIAGLPVVGRLAERMDLEPGWKTFLEDGTTIAAGRRIASISGSMRALLGFERTALNILQHLSGIATLTARYVEEVSGTKTKIFDTRKTLPGWRLLEKYAVRCGGGCNHRIGLFDAVLIKDNHLGWLEHEGDPIGCAVKKARSFVPAGTIVEVEVDTMSQLNRALECGPDIILVDNFSPDQLSVAIHRRDAIAPSILIESSGGISLDSLRDRAVRGVDRISVGALTHSAPAFDLGLDFDRVVP